MTLESTNGGREADDSGSALGDVEGLSTVPEYVLALTEASTETIACPLCSSEDHEPVYEGIALRGNDLVCVICRNCTHLFLNPRPPMGAYKSFYNGDNYFHLCANYSEVSLDQKLAQFDDESFWKDRSGHSERLNSVYLKGAVTAEDTVFDFGCGDGAWLLALRNLTGCQIAGQEISRVYADVIKEHLDVDVYLGPIEELREEIVRDFAGKVKLVIVSGSLQHMLDPMKSLAIAREILTPDGLLYVCNWNLFDHYMTPFKGDTQRLLGEILSWEHCHYFHEHSFKFMLENAGFEILGLQLASQVRMRHMDAFARRGELVGHATPAARPEDVIARLHARESSTIASRIRMM